MDKAELKSFGKPDKAADWPTGRMEFVNIGGAEVRRVIFQPGWRTAKSCGLGHLFYHVSGVLRIRMDDGDEFDCRPGDVSLLPSGHNAWVVGDEPVVVVDFQPMLDHAKAG